MKKVYTIKTDYEDARLDRWFRKNISQVPQSLIEKNLRKGKIKVNNKKVKSSYKLKKNDKICLYNVVYKTNVISKKAYVPNKNIIKETESYIIENNEDFIVINKKAGLPVQGGTKVKENVINILTNSIHFQNTKPFIVHRIDKDTSGALIIAKNRSTAQQLTSLFRIRSVHKTYLAITFGNTDKKKDILDNNLIRYEGNKKILERAITHYQKIDTNNKIRATGSSQKEILFILGNAISGAPIIIGTNQFPNPPIIAGITIKKIMIKP